MENLLRKLAVVSTDEPTILILCKLERSPTHFFLPCDHWFHDGLKYSFHYSLLLEQKFGWALSPSPCSFLFNLHVEWSLKEVLIKYQMQFVFCELLFHFCLRFKFSTAWIYFWRDAQKKRKKANREKIKFRWTVLQRYNLYFFMVLCVIRLG